MVSQYSSSVLYLTDDEEEEDNEPEPTGSYGDSYTSAVNNNLPRRKRRWPEGNVRVNPSIVNWSKRQRNDHYPHQHAVLNSMHHPEHEPMTYHPDVYDFTEQESHSFHAFDWTSEPQIQPRMCPNSMPPMSIVPPPHVMNVVKHHLDQSDSVSIIPMSRQNERYVQQSSRKSMTIPISPTPPPPALVLPLPTPTSSLVRPQAQRVHSGKNLRVPYLSSTPPPPPPPPHPSTKSAFSSSSSSTTTAYHHPSHISVSTREILRQALNGTGVLSAFYDSKCYRCNICKFITLTSSKLLQHLFTHIFFCHQCPFYTYSQHTLVQHVFDKHHSTMPSDFLDPKSLELLYITRCSDGTFALCMDSSSTPGAHSTTTTEKVPPPPEPTKKPKRTPRPKKPANNEIAVLPEKPAAVPQPSTSTIAKRPIPKEKPTITYVLMKHRRGYSSRSQPCLHSLTLEYNICREHTIQHMCHTYGRFERRRILSKSGRRNLTDQVASCLRTMVNQIVDNEENEFEQTRSSSEFSRNSSDTVCLLPNHILNSILPSVDLQTMTNLLKLTNKYDRTIEQNTRHHLESTVRSSQQHVFVLSSNGINRNEQANFPALQTSITGADSASTETKLNKLPISYDNTNRFLKGSLNLPPQSTAKPPFTNDVNLPPKHFESTAATLLKPPRQRESSKLDNNNNSVTFSKPRSSPSPTVIVID